MFQKKRVATRRLKYRISSISSGFAARDGSAVKSHSTILQRLRRQISLDYYTIPPATQARKTMERAGVIKLSVIKQWSKGWSRARRISLKSNHWQDHSTALRN